MSSMSPMVGVPIIAAVVAVGIVSLVWQFSRSRSLVEQWAAENGFELLDADYRNGFKGPFFWTSTKGQTVYHVQVRDQAGKIRSGWVRCGSWCFGLLSDQTEVRWENQAL